MSSIFKDTNSLSIYQHISRNGLSWKITFISPSGRSPSVFISSSSFVFIRHFYFCLFLLSFWISVVSILSKEVFIPVHRHACTQTDRQTNTQGTIVAGYLEIAGSAWEDDLMAVIRVRPTQDFLSLFQLRCTWRWPRHRCLKAPASNGYERA